MNPFFHEFGKILLLIGCLMIIAGLLMLFLPKVPLIGRLPGDFVIRKGNFTFYFPLATSILLSILLTIIFSIFRR